MISHIFSKTKPINFLLLIFLLAIYIVLYEGFVGIENNSSAPFLQNSAQNLGFFAKAIGLLVPSIFLMDFVLKRNKLVLTQAYTLLFFVIFTGIFTAVFKSTSLLLSHFFVLMGLRRIISLKNKGRSKKKVFEASLWFLVASFFYDWALLYFVVLFLAVFLHNKNAIQHLGLMVWAAGVYALLLQAFVIGTQGSEFFQTHYIFLISTAPLKEKIGLELSLFFGSSLLLLIWLVTKSRNTTNPSLGRQNSLRLLFLSALVGLGLYFLSPDPGFSPLIFSFFPMAFLWSRLTEELTKTWQKELLLWSALSVPLWGLLAYLIQN